MGKKWLCLHGGGTNKEMFQCQLAMITYQLQRQRGDEFIWLDGTCEGKETNTRDLQGTTDGPFLFWWDFGNQDELRADQAAAMPRVRTAMDTSHRRIKDAFARHGPFDGVIGYSQGGTLIADILIRQALQPDIGSLQEGGDPALVLIGAPSPPDLWSNGDTYEGPANKERVGGAILNSPALIVNGKDDVWHEDIDSLAEIWSPGTAQRLEYDGNHDLPKSLTVYEEIIESITQMV